MWSVVDFIWKHPFLPSRAAENGPTEATKEETPQKEVKSPAGLPRTASAPLLACDQETPTPNIAPNWALNSSRKLQGSLSTLESSSKKSRSRLARARWANAAATLASPGHLTASRLFFSTPQPSGVRGACAPYSLEGTNFSISHREFASPGPGELLRQESDTSTESSDNEREEGKQEKPVGREASTPEELPAASDDAGVFAVATRACSVVEGEGKGVEVTVLRVGGGLGPATVHFTTKDGKAKGGVDYMPTEGRVHFKSGEFSKVITLNAEGKRGHQGNRSFKLILTSCTNGSLTRSRVTTITIIETETSFPMRLLHNVWFGALVFCASVFTLAGADITLLYLDKDWDGVLSAAASVCILLFLLEMWCLVAVKRNNYLWTTLFFMDVLSIVGLVFFMPVLPIGVSKIGNLDVSIIRAARAARAGSAVGRTTRVPAAIAQGFREALNKAHVLLWRAWQAAKEAAGYNNPKRKAPATAPETGGLPHSNSMLDLAAPSGNSNPKAGNNNPKPGVPEPWLMVEAPGNAEEKENSKEPDKKGEGGSSLGLSGFKPATARIGFVAVEFVIGRIIAMMMLLLVVTVWLVSSHPGQPELHLAQLHYVSLASGTGPLNSPLGFQGISLYGNFVELQTQDIIFLRIDGQTVSDDLMRAATNGTVGIDRAKLDQVREGWMFFVGVSRVVPGYEFLYEEAGLDCGDSVFAAVNSNPIKCPTVVVIDNSAQIQKDLRNNLYLTLVLVVILAVGAALVATDVNRMLVHPLDQLTSVFKLLSGLTENKGSKTQPPAKPEEDLLKPSPSGEQPSKSSNNFIEKWQTIGARLSRKWSGGRSENKNLGFGWLALPTPKVKERDLEAGDENKEEFSRISPKNDVRNGSENRSKMGRKLSRKDRNISEVSPDSKDQHDYSNSLQIQASRQSQTESQTDPQSQTKSQPSSGDVSFQSQTRPCPCGDSECKGFRDLTELDEDSEQKPEEESGGLVGSVVLAVKRLASLNSEDVRQISKMLDDVEKAFGWKLIDLRVWASEVAEWNEMMATVGASIKASFWEETLTLGELRTKVSLMLGRLKPPDWASDSSEIRTGYRVAVTLGKILLELADFAGRQICQLFTSVGVEVGATDQLTLQNVRELLLSLIIRHQLLERLGETPPDNLEDFKLLDLQEYVTAMFRKRIKDYLEKQGLSVPESFSSVSTRHLQKAFSALKAHALYHKLREAGLPLLDGAAKAKTKSSLQPYVKLAFHKAASKTLRHYRATPPINLQQPPEELRSSNVTIDLSRAEPLASALAALEALPPLEVYTAIIAPIGSAKQSMRNDSYSKTRERFTNRSTQNLDTLVGSSSASNLEALTSARNGPYLEQTFWGEQGDDESAFLSVHRIRHKLWVVVSEVWGVWGRLDLGRGSRDLLFEAANEKLKERVEKAVIKRAWEGISARSVHIKGTVPAEPLDLSSFEGALRKGARALVCSVLSAHGMLPAVPPFRLKTATLDDLARLAVMSVLKFPPGLKRMVGAIERAPPRQAQELLKQMGAVSPSSAPPSPSSVAATAVSWLASQLAAHQITPPPGFPSLPPPQAADLAEALLAERARQELSQDPKTSSLLTSPQAPAGVDDPAPSHASLMSEMTSALYSEVAAVLARTGFEIAAEDLTAGGPLQFERVVSSAVKAQVREAARVVQVATGQSAGDDGGTVVAAVEWLTQGGGTLSRSASLDLQGVESSYTVLEIQGQPWEELLAEETDRLVGLTESQGQALYQECLEVLGACVEGWLVEECWEMIEGSRKKKCEEVERVKGETNPRSVPELEKALQELARTSAASVFTKFGQTPRANLAAEPLEVLSSLKATVTLQDLPEMQRLLDALKLLPIHSEDDDAVRRLFVNSGYPEQWLEFLPPGTSLPALDDVLQSPKTYLGLIIAQVVVRVGLSSNEQNDDFAETFTKLGSGLVHIVQHVKEMYAQVETPKGPEKETPSA